MKDLDDTKAYREEMNIRVLDYMGCYERLQASLAKLVLHAEGSGEFPMLEKQTEHLTWLKQAVCGSDDLTKIYNRCDWYRNRKDV